MIERMSLARQTAALRSVLELLALIAMACSTSPRTNDQCQ